MKAGGDLLINTLKVPLRNDVTDFIRSAIASGDTPVDTIQNNLIAAYRKVDALDSFVLAEDAKESAQRMCDKEMLMVKIEAIYLVTRIQTQNKAVPAFLEEISKKIEDPYILLDIAYAATLTGPQKVALDYAKTLVPGSQNDITNRSWTLAYYGDVQANPYEYQDTNRVSWTKAREARLRRLQKADYKSLRFRILDFPLLYCFYSDRQWQDVNKGDFQIIRDADIDNEVFSGEEKEFLMQKKKELLHAFSRHLSISLD